MKTKPRHNQGGNHKNKTKEDINKKNDNVYIMWYKNDT